MQDDSNPGAGQSGRSHHDLVGLAFQCGTCLAAAAIHRRDPYVPGAGDGAGPCVGADLLVSLFAPYGPLHDGAVLIDSDTIIAAGVILPLTQFPVADKSLGTRHRAALGLSEETDALIIVVSEETSQISLAYRGRLSRNETLDTVRTALAGGSIDTLSSGDGR